MSISVCMATYNGEKYIKQQVESILVQLDEDDELIVSDDSSTDHTVCILKSFNDPRIKIFNNTKKRGVTHNFENAIEKSTGSFIFLSDQDDVWEKDKVEKVLAKLNEVDLVLHNGQLIDGEGKLINQDLFSIYKTRKGYLKNLTRNTFVGCCMAFKRELIAEILPIPNKIMMHDMWIALVAEKKGSTALLPEQLIQYRRHENNASTTSKKSSNTLFFQIKYRLQMLFYTILK